MRNVYIQRTALLQHRVLFHEIGGHREQVSAWVGDGLSPLFVYPEHPHVGLLSQILHIPSMRYPATQKAVKRQVVTGEQAFPERPLLGFHISSGSGGREAPTLHRVDPKIFGYRSCGLLGGTVGKTSPGPRAARVCKSDDRWLQGWQPFGLDFREESRDGWKPATALTETTNCLHPSRGHGGANRSNRFSCAYNRCGSIGVDSGRSSRFSNCSS